MPVEAVIGQTGTHPTKGASRATELHKDGSQKPTKYLGTNLALSPADLFGSGPEAPEPKWNPFRSAACVGACRCGDQGIRLLDQLERMCSTVCSAAHVLPHLS